MTCDGDDNGLDYSARAFCLFYFSATLPITTSMTIKLAAISVVIS